MNRERLFHHKDVPQGKKREFAISVVLETSDSEKYIQESLDSLVNQSIGFEENIQVILMKRHHDEACDLILKEYLDRYPDNIVLLEFDSHTKLGRAKNESLQYIQGKYVNFMGKDDLWSQSAFNRIVDCFNENAGLFDIVACRVKYFGALHNYHEQDERFRRNRIIWAFEEKIEALNVIEESESEALSEKINDNDENGLNNEGNNNNLSDLEDSVEFNKEDILASREELLDYFALNMVTDPRNIFVKRELLEKDCFDPRLNHAEDIVFFTKLLVEKECYAVLKKARYNQRVIKTNKFAVDKKPKEKSYYFDTMRYAYGELFSLFEGSGENIQTYIQMLTMHEIGKRLLDSAVDVSLTPSEKAEYKELLKSLLCSIDNDVIFKQNNIYTEFKLYALRLKLGDINKYITFDGTKVLFDNVYIFGLSKPSIVRVETMDIEGNTLKLDGIAGIPFPDDMYTIYFQDKRGKKYYLEKSRYEKSVYALNEPCFTWHGFALRIPVKKDNVLTPYILFAGKRFKLKIDYMRWAKFERTFEHPYYKKNGITVTRAKKELLIYKNAERAPFEKAFLREVWQKGYKKEAIARACFFIARRFNKKKIWLIADNLEDGNDNAEILAKWISEYGDHDRELLFILNKHTEAEKRIKKFCKVVHYGTLKHKLSFLLADVFICSRTDPHIFNFLNKYRKVFKDFFPTFIYLQHGILEKDFTRAVNKFNNNFRVFITSVKMEYENMLRLPYGWDDTEIRLTGLARHDEIYNMTHSQEKELVNEVIIAPTWRKNLALRKDNVWIYYPEFKESDFFQFYNGVMNDNRVLSVMREYGYKGKLRLHTVIKANACDFQLNDVFELDDRNLLFREQFHVGRKILLTDYSSIAFDYAYAKIPVIYSQFDKDQIYNIQSYDQGFFDYEKDGFGPVCYDYESTVQAIIDLIKNDCVLDDEYEIRREKFFEYYDNKNSERIYNVIKEVDR